MVSNKKSYFAMLWRAVYFMLRSAVVLHLHHTPC